MYFLLSEVLTRKNNFMFLVCAYFQIVNCEMMKPSLGKIHPDDLKSPQSSPERATLKLKRFKCKNRREIIESIQQKEDTNQSISTPLKQRTLNVIRNSSKEIGASPDSRIIIDDDAMVNSFNDSFINESKSNILQSEDILSIPSSPPMTPQYKRVAFSSDIDNSFVSSSPLKSSPSKPRRSILKQSNVRVNKALSVDELLKTGLSDNWPDGYVLHVPESYLNKAKVVRACVSFLQNPKCNKKYEIFATLNHLIKISSNNICLSFSLDSVYNLLKSIEDDLIDLRREISEDAVSPFRLRVSSQGIKLLSSLQKLVINNEVANSCSKIILDIMKSENISKSLAASIIQLWKSKELKDMDDQVEHLIVNIIQMKYFLSATVICERVNILNRIILARPAISSKYGYQILSYLLMTIMNTDVPSYSKILTICVNAITQFGKHSENKSIIIKILEEPINDNLSSMKSHISDSLTQQSTISDALVLTLLYANHINIGKQVIECWFQVLFLCSYRQVNFSIPKWKLGGQLIGVFESLLSSASDENLQLCLDKWNIIIYNFQINDISKDDTFTVQTKLKTLLVPFLKTMDASIFAEFYYKLFYAIQWKMTKYNYDGHIRKELVKTMLWPILNVQLEDSGVKYDFSPILTKICAIDSTTPTTNKFSDPETGLFLTDSNQWKQMICPINEKMYIDSFPTICKIIEGGFKDGQFGEWCDTLSNVIYQPLYYLKSKDIEEYSLLFQNVHSMIINILKNFNEKLVNATKDQAKDFFKLIQDADIGLVFEPSDTSLLFKIANEMSQCLDIEFINEFITICLSKFNSDSVFSAFITSDIYKNLKLVRKACSQRSFPPFLNYWVNLEKLKEKGNFDLTKSDPSLLSIRFKYFFSSYLKESANGDDFLKRVGNEMNAVIDYNIFEYFDDGIYSFVFDMMLHGFIEFGKQDRFYKVMKLDFFKIVMDKMTLNWSKYMDLIISLPNVKLMSTEWFKYMLSNISQHLERGAEFKDEFKKIVDTIKKHVDRKDRDAFNKLCKKLKIIEPIKPTLAKGQKLIEDTQLITDSVVIPGRRTTRSGNMKENTFERETVLKLRKRPLSFEPSSPIKEPPPDSKRQKIMEMMKINLERTSSDMGDGESEGISKDEFEQFRQNVSELNGKRIDVLTGDEREELTKQLLIMVMKLNNT